MTFIEYAPWIEFSGEWHIYKMGESVTLCGECLEGSNHEDMPVDQLIRCEVCHDEMARRVVLLSIEHVIVINPRL